MHRFIGLIRVLITWANEPFAANGHMVQNPPYWRASCTLEQSFQTKRLHQVKFEFSLFWMSQCVACSPAWWILYHVTVSCKGPIYTLQFSFSIGAAQVEN